MVCLLLACLWPALTYARCLGVVTAGGGEDFWLRVQQGAMDAGEELLIDVFTRGVKDESDALHQAKIIDAIADRGCIGMVIAPNSPERDTQVMQLLSRGIPSVYVDRDPGGARKAAVLTDNFAAGELAAQTIVDMLPPKSRVGILRLAKNVPSTSEREAGFILHIEQAGHTIILDEYLGTTLSEANQNAYQALVGAPQLDALFTPNESTTLAVLRMRKRLNEHQAMLHVGFDTNPLFIEAIEKGKLSAIVIQQPRLMGQTAVHTLYKILRGHSVEPVIHTPTALVLPSNLEQYRTHFAPLKK